MAKDTERTYNGSYLYRLNQELSGQQELAPYFITDEAGDETLEDSEAEQKTVGSADDEADADFGPAANQNEELT